MTATLTNQEYAANEATNGTRALSFSHALCAIKFQTGTDIAGGTINSITFNNIYKDGKYSLVNNEWDFTGKSTGNVSYTGLNIATTSGTSGTNILTSNSNLLLMIPQSFTNANQKITISFTDVYGVTSSLSCSLNETSWTAGKCITYTVNGVGGFVTKVSDKTRNPLWYMARYNSNKNGTFSKTATCASGDWRFNYGAAIQSFAGNATRTGYYTQNITVSNADTGENESSYKYHLPTLQEFYSIIPNDYNLFNTEHLPVSSSNTYTEPSSVFHHANAHTATAYKSYWGNVFKSGYNYTRYSIRFLGTNYCSVWSYRLLDYVPVASASTNYPSSTARLEIKSEVIGAISASETTRLSAIISALENGTYVWSSYALTRSLWFCGYCGSATGNVQYQQGSRALYMTATDYDTSNCYYFNAYSDDDYYQARMVYHSKSHGLSVRLFKD